MAIKGSNGNWYVDSEGELKRLGEGGYGTVFQARNITNGKTVAIKVINGADTKEIELMLKIPPHENIVALLDYWTLDFSKCLVMDIADCDLTYIVKEEWSDCAPESDELTSYVNMLINGVRHLHKHKILHRDLKPANVLRFEDDKGDMVLRITDFGISKQLDTTGQQQNTHNIGTQSYMAPEMLLQQSYTKQVDIWALGLVIYYMAIGEKK